jgi:hypothetical protein
MANIQNESPNLKLKIVSKRQNSEDPSLQSNDSDTTASKMPQSMGPIINSQIEQTPSFNQSNHPLQPPHPHISLSFNFLPYSDRDFLVKLRFTTSVDLSVPAKFPEILTTPTSIACILPILHQTILASDAADFLRPVDHGVEKAPNDSDIIAHPVDLSLMLKKANSKSYSSFDQFSSDMKQLIDNAVRFNPSSHRVHQSAIRLSGFIRDLFLKIEENSQEIISLNNGAAADSKIEHAFNDYRKRKKELAKSAEKDQMKVPKVS